MGWDTLGEPQLGSLTDGGGCCLSRGVGGPGAVKSWERCCTGSWAEGAKFGDFAGVQPALGPKVRARQSKEVVL